MKKSDVKYLAIHFLFFAFREHFCVFCDQCIAGLMVLCRDLDIFKVICLGGVKLFQGQSFGRVSSFKVNHLSIRYCLLNSTNS